MNKLWSHILILCFALLAVHLTLSVPFYYSWDMDLTTVLDLLLMQNNQIPAHMNHPGMGMYWVLFWFQWVAQHLGLITHVSMANIGDSLEPLLLLTEQMQFVRVINSMACIALSVVLWKSIRPYLKVSGWGDAVLLLVCLTVPGLWRYDLLLVRTETYSLLFWCLSLLYTIRSTESELKKDKILAGFFAALSFFTKIQSFFLIILLVLIYAFLKKTSAQVAVFNQKRKMLVYLVGFALVSFIAMHINQPTYLADFAERYQPNKFFVCFYLLLFLLFFISLKWRKWHPEESLQNFVLYFLGGAALVMLVPLVSPLSAEVSAQYSLLSFKMVFLRETKFSALNQLDLFTNLKQLVKANWHYMLVLAISTSVVFFKKESRKWVLVFLGALMSIQIILAVRSSIQDSIWIEIPLVVLSLLMIGRLSSKWTKAGVFLLLIINVYKITGFKNFVITPFIAYYDSHMYFNEVYGMDIYKPIMDQRYTSVDERNSALAIAGRLSEIKSVLASNFPASGVGLRDVTVIDGKLWVSLSRVQLSEVKLLYRPDLTQSIYVPADQFTGLQVEECEKTAAAALTYKNTPYVGLVLKGVNNKGIYTSNCIIKSENLQKAFISIENKAMATFRNSQL